VTTAVFVGGCPRSGTTLLGVSLAKRFRGVVTPESQFKTEWDRAGAEDARSYVASHARFGLWGSPAPDTSPGATIADVVRSAVRGYADATGQDRSAPWIDHTPNNLRFAATLDRRFGHDVRYVHLVRDGRAVAHSILSLDWGPSTPVAAGRFWAAEVGVALAAEAHLGSRCMRVRFEDLVAEPDATVDAVGEWAGLERADASAVPMPDYYTSRYHGLLVGAVDPGRATAWRAAMPRRDVELVEFASGELLTFLGYDADFGASARPPSGSERVRAAAKELTTDAIVNRVRWRRSMRGAAKPSPPDATDGERP